MPSPIPTNKTLYNEVKKWPSLYASSWVVGEWTVYKMK